MENGIRRTVLRSLFMLHRKDVLWVASTRATVDPGCYLVRNHEKTLHLLCEGGRGLQVFGDRRVRAEVSLSAPSLCPGRSQDRHKVTAEHQGHGHCAPWFTDSSSSCHCRVPEGSPLPLLPKDTQCRVAEDPWAPGSHCHHDGKLNHTHNCRTGKGYPYCWYYSELHFILSKIHGHQLHNPPYCKNSPRDAVLPMGHFPWFKELKPPLPPGTARQNPQLTRALGQLQLSQVWNSALVFSFQRWVFVREGRRLPWSGKCKLISDLL